MILKFILGAFAIFGHHQKSLHKYLNKFQLINYNNKGLFPNEEKKLHFCINTN